MGGLLEELVKRFHALEVSQTKLREQMQMILEHGRGMRRARDDSGDDHERSDNGDGGGGAAVHVIPGHFVRGLYHGVLNHIGHALHVYRPHTGEIIFWNRSAENLYGWKEEEALGRRVRDLLMQEDSLREIMERLSKGQTWSGQLLLKKRSGETLTAVVTKSPLFEDGAFAGVIVVSSDAALLNDKHKEMSGGNQEQAHGQPPREAKRVLWCHRPLIASSVSTLASKVALRNRALGDYKNATHRDG